MSLVVWTRLLRTTRLRSGWTGAACGRRRSGWLRLGCGGGLGGNGLFFFGGWRGFLLLRFDDRTRRANPGSRRRWLWFGRSAGLLGGFRLGSLQEFLDDWSLTRRLRLSRCYRLRTAGRLDNGTGRTYLPSALGRLRRGLRLPHDHIAGPVLQLLPGENRYDHFVIDRCRRIHDLNTE